MIEVGVLSGLVVVLEAWYGVAELVVDGHLGHGDPAHLETDGLGHALGLIGENFGIAEAPPVLTSLLPHLVILNDSYVVIS